MEPGPREHQEELARSSTARKSPRITALVEMIRTLVVGTGDAPKEQIESWANALSKLVQRRRYRNGESTPSDQC